MTDTRTSRWDRLPLRVKGALIVGAPLAALLAVAVTSFWFDRQSDARERLANRAAAAHDAIDDLGHRLEGVAVRLQRYTVTEDPGTLPPIGPDLLEDVRSVGLLRHPRTGEPYGGVRQTTAAAREVLLRADVLAGEMTTGPAASERQEDSLDLLTGRLFALADLLELPKEEAAEAVAAYERELMALEGREGTADAIMLLVGSLGSLVAVAFFARNFTTRIAELGTASEHLAAGDFTRPFPRGSDEIGRLGERLYSAFSDLRASEERSRLILETSIDAYGALDENWTFTAWNRAAESVFGWTKEEAIGTHLLDLTVPAEARGAYVSDVGVFLETGESAFLNRRVETVAIHKDGHEVPIELSIVPISSGGRLTFHAFARDLTETKAAEAAALRRARRMADIIQTMSDMASAEMDVRLLHDLLLERAQSVTGADGVALQLEHCGKLKIVAGVGPVAGHVGRELDIATSMIGQTLTTGQTILTGDIFAEAGFDAPLARDIGTRSAVTVPLRDAGRVVGVLAVHGAPTDAFDETDVTDLELLGGFFGAIIGKLQAYVAREVVVRERTEALEELRQLHDELAAKNAALVAATEEATAANRAKSEFLSRMSHELRTPLNAILGFAQLLQSEPLAEDQLDSLVHIEKAGRHLLELINEVLDIARIESGRTPVSLERADLGHLVGETVELIRPLAAQRSISVDLSGPPAVEAWTDERKVRQILLNLLSNAVKYNRDGGAIRVGIERGDGGIALTVADTGPGIPQDELRSLFTPFQRLGAERTTVEGTGLGLAVSKKLAEAMGADLSVETTDEGSTFTLWLPSSEPGHPPHHEASPPSSRGGAPARDYLLVVLCVEDDAASARLVERALTSRRDVDVRVVGTGREAVTAAASILPSVILLDMNLPDATGIEVLATLRADRRTSGIPVVVLSADATADRAGAALEEGAAGYLTKPLDLPQLLQTIDAVVATRARS